jgi:serine/threonine protein kinase
MIHWYHQLLNVVSFLHKNKIVHKNIDKSHILLVNSNLKLVCSEKSEKLLKRDGKIDVFQGDYAFESPEIEMSNQIDYKYDIWCLGWLLYEFCTFKSPLEILTIKKFANLNKLILENNTPDEICHLFKK